MFLLEYPVWIALRVLRLHKLWCAADSSNLTSERPESFWWEYDGLLSRNCVRNESLRFLKAQLLHPFCEMQRQVGVILSHFRKCLYREVFFFWSEAKKAAFLKFFLKTFTSVSFDLMHRKHFPLWQEDTFFRHFSYNVYKVFTHRFHTSSFFSSEVLQFHCKFDFWVVKYLVS